MSGQKRENSPVTGVIDEVTVILDFGKYEGLSVCEIFDLDRDFYNELTVLKEKGEFSIRRQTDKVSAMPRFPSSRDHRRKLRGSNIPREPVAASLRRCHQIW